MKNRFPVGLVAIAALLGSARLAVAADGSGSFGVTSDTILNTGAAAAGATIPAVSPARPMVAAVRPAMAEVFHPAPLPGEDDRLPTHQGSDGGPNLHPDVLSMHEKSDGVLGDTDLAYNRNERMKPAGGMSLDIPMQ